MKVVIAVAHAMTWFWTQTCLAAIKRTLPAYDYLDIEIVVVDNSWDNSPSIRGVTDTRLGEGVRVINNTAAFLCHSAALDAAFEATWPMDYFVPVDSDVVVRKEEWLGELLSRLQPRDYAVGAWHHQQWVYPSLALYRGEVVRAMADASGKNDGTHMRWGERFELSAPVREGEEQLIRGPFSERRGWPEGTVLGVQPTGQMKGAGHYEPGQQFHHWAVERGYTCSVCPSVTVWDHGRAIPLGTFYGVESGGYDEGVRDCWAVHFWAGTRALDFLNPRGGHLTDHHIVDNMAFWLEREAGWWGNVVPEDVQKETLSLIRKHGWTFNPRADAPPDAVERIAEWYKRAGVNLD